MKPTPVEIARITDPEDVLSHRQIYCRQYDRCLNTAINRDWDSFACNRCKAFEPFTFEELRQDMHGMSELWQGVGYFERIDRLTETERAWKSTTLLEGNSAAVSIKNFLPSRKRG